MTTPSAADAFYIVFAVLAGTDGMLAVIGVGSAIGLRKNDTELRDKLDAAIAAAFANSNLDAAALLRLLETRLEGRESTIAVQPLYTRGQGQ